MVSTVRPKDSTSSFNSSTSAGGQVAAGEQVDLIRDGRATLCQTGNDRLYGGGVPFLQRPAVIGRGGPDDRDRIMLGMLLAELLDGTVDIIAHGLGQTGCHHPHHLGLELLDHPADTLFQVFPAAEDGAVLAHGRGIQGDGLLVVPGELQTDKGRTPLGTVQQTEHIVNPQVGHGGPQGGRILLWVDRGGLGRNLDP